MSDGANSSSFTQTVIYHQTATEVKQADEEDLSSQCEDWHWQVDALRSVDRETAAPACRAQAPVALKGITITGRGPCARDWDDDGGQGFCFLAGAWLKTRRSRPRRSPSLQPVLPSVQPPHLQPRRASVTRCAASPLDDKRLARWSPAEI